MFPNREVIYVTHSGNFAAEQGEALRTMLMEHGPSYGITVSKESGAKDDFDICDLNGKKTGGSFRCFGINSGIHGRGCSLLILDDLFKNVEDAVSATVRDSIWRTYTSSLHTRLTPGGSIVSIGTPLHWDDWFGRIKQSEIAGGEKWSWIKLHAVAREGDPLGRVEGEALWPLGGWTIEELDAKKRNLIVSGNFRDWMSQYELEPISGDGVSEWPDTYFERILRPYTYKEPFWANVLAIDTSKGAKAQKRADWQSFGYLEADSGGHIRVNCELHRLDVNGLRNKSRELYDAWNPTVIVVETNGAGYALLEDLWGMGLPAIGRYHAPGIDKITRLTQRLGRAFELGVLHFEDTPGSRMVVEMARLFPHGKYDDGLDSLEMGLEFVGQMKLPKAKRKVQYQFRGMEVAGGPRRVSG